MHGRFYLCFLFVLCFAVGAAAIGHAETPAPSVHWGALAYPDQERTLMAGLTLNRFTEFNNSGQPYDSTVHQTIGFNFASLTWTERFNAWATNLTVGAGPTSDQPTRYLQNNFAHRLFHFKPVPVGAAREATDFMIDGSVTRWAKLWDDRETGFGGIGVSSGTLYHEGFLRLGMRRMPFPIASYLRLSVMGRYSQLWKASAFNQVAGQSYMGQFSLSLGNYTQTNTPEWEFELGANIDTGLFVDPRGRSLQEKFGTVALRFPYGRFEMWDDAINFKDKGPTYGGTLMFDLLALIKVFG